MRNILLIAFFAAFGVSLMAQPLRKVPVRMMLETAEESMAQNDYYNALDWFGQAYKETKDKDLAIKIAELHYKLRDYKKASNYYKRVLSRDKTNKYASHRMMYAKSLKYEGKYEESYAEFKKFLDESEDTELKKVALAEANGIVMASKLEENIGTVIELADRNVNSAFTEFAPSAYNDGTLYFSSFMRKNPIVLDGKEDDYHAKIYTTAKGDKGYAKAKALGNHINREGYHTGNASFSKDGKRMYFTRSQVEGNELIESKIFLSYYSDSGWSPAIELEGVNGEYIAKHPSVGELYGNEVLFFVANMEGGHGGFDIYYSNVSGDGPYASPVNLGTSINTAMDEATPAYRDGLLYFSSEGHPNMGGFDIYSTEWNGSEWSEITNMGKGYNSSYDDLYFSLDEEGYNGFLVSNRPTEGKRSLKSKTCCDDIYTFNIRKVVIDLLAIVKDANGPLNGAEMTLKDITPEEPALPASKSNADGNNFNFLLDGDHSYTLEISKEGFFPKTIEFNTVGILDDYTVNKTIVLEPIPEPEPEIEVEILTINEPIRLNNIYYEYDDDKILLDAEQDLFKILGLMNQYPDMVIELSSHTDSRGVSTYNQKLSQRRAESAKRWLLDKGISDDRIQAVGYGETQILNQCTNGTKCSDEEHRFNRRTTFKIIAGPQTIEIKKEVKKKQN